MAIVRLGVKPPHIASVAEQTVASAIEAHIDPGHQDSPHARGLPLDPWDSDWSRVLTSTLPEVHASDRTSIVTSLRTFWPDRSPSHPGGSASTVVGDPGPSASRAGR